MTSFDDAGHVPPRDLAPPQVRDELGRRLDGLGAAVDGARGRIHDDVLADAVELTGRVRERLTLSGQHTIVALAGATGSGKSSLFNTLTDMELAGVGVRRPTTSWALACAWGPDGAGELLAWMGIPARHQVSRMGMLERADDAASLEGLILLDLPDHDSTEVSHHLEMDRLVTYSDLLIWVLDPQKYADAAIHERYIRKMARFGAVTLVVLNQIDRIPYEQRAAAVADVKRLIEADGLPDVKVLGVSATRGDGIDDLRRELADRIRAKSAAKARLLADVGRAAAAIAETGGMEPAPEIGATDQSRLVDAVAQAADVPEVTRSVSVAARRRTLSRTRWPVLAAFTRSRGDVPSVGRVQQAACELAARDVVDHVADGLSYPWRSSVRAAAQRDSRAVAEALSATIERVTARGVRVPVWARLVQIVQWLVLLAAVAGLTWWATLGLERATEAVDVSFLPEVGRTAGVDDVGWAGMGALGLGLVLDLVSRVAARISARRRQRWAERELRSAIDEATERHVVGPLKAELTVYESYRQGLLLAMG